MVGNTQRRANIIPIAAHRSASSHYSHIPEIPAIADTPECATVSACSSMSVCVCVCGLVAVLISELKLNCVVKIAQSEEKKERKC